MARKKSTGPSARDVAEVAVGKGSARDIAEAAGVRGGRTRGVRRGRTNRHPAHSSIHHALAGKSLNAVELGARPHNPATNLHPHIPPKGAHSRHRRLT
jgi:hypothetical protein